VSVAHFNPEKIRELVGVWDGFRRLEGLAALYAATYLDVFVANRTLDNPTVFWLGS
jgi:hypothetical protein